MSEIKKGVPYEVRLYEMLRAKSSTIIRRLADTNTNESLYFGQCQLTMMVETPQGPMPVPQTGWYPIEGATSPANAFELADAAFEKFKANIPGQRIAVATGMPPMPPAPGKAPRGNGPVPNGLRMV